ncbi:hypothetical protein PG993_002179 [Apiospora rasikravindrae]|uniref:BZIP domain-containing protein n=1 Tax=Apiospora rasikravindrae TaxID=990691 RepID=A0ABR1UDH0_9PEZI
MATQSQGDHDDRDDDGSSLRPSFTKFWKRLKPKSGPRRNFTFVSANPGLPNAGSESEALRQQQQQQQQQQRHGESLDKAEARRAQVRRAQIQHRQRKVDYAKGLETDIVRLRDAIEGCKVDCRELAGDNRGMREQLASVAMVTGPPAQQRQQGPLGTEYTDQSVMSGIECSAMMMIPESSITGIANPRPPTDGFAGDADPAVVWAASSLPSLEPHRMAYLNVDENLGSPAFQVTRGTMADQEGYAGSAEEIQALSIMLGGTVDQAELAQGPDEETYRAINFILALEHTCWDHFTAAHSQLCDGIQPPSANPAVTSCSAGDVDDAYHGHALMVSAMALQQAPGSVLRGLENVAAAAAATGPISSPKEIPRANTGNSLAWRATGLTLESLHGLASTLNPPDLELAPVQAWFEMVREYGQEAVLDDDGRVLDTLIAELRGMVKCLSFGAVIERAAFDDVLRKVLGDR